MKNKIITQEKMEKLAELLYPYWKDIENPDEHINELRNSDKREEYMTLAFINLNEEKKAREEIKTHYKKRIICAEIIEGTDERGNTGFIIVYALTKK